MRWGGSAASWICRLRAWPGCWGLRAMITAGHRKCCRGLVREWTKTTNPPDGEAPVEPYFSGIQVSEYSVSIIWRVHVPGEGQRLWPRAGDREAADVAIGEVRMALQDDEDLHRLAPDGVTVELTRAADLRPGDQIILAADRGLLDESGWNPAASCPVVDASLTGQGVPLDAKAIERLCGVDVTAQLAIALETDEHEDVDHASRDEAVQAIRARLREAATPPGWGDREWSEFTDALGSSVEEPRREVPRLTCRTDEALRPSSDLSSDFDETSLSPAAVRLDEHGRAVGALARVIAERIGLRADLTEVVERAGALHDIGKADARFQRRLDPEGRSDELLAKSDTHRVTAGRRRMVGGRGAAVTRPCQPAWCTSGSNRTHPGAIPNRRDLLLHLVISHHGKGRPLVPPVTDRTPPMVSAVVDGASVEAPADLAIVDWSQPRRFRRLNERFGPWGLALLEAIVRLADWTVSAGADVPQGAPR